ncbi:MULTISPECIES: hypothetical protein [Mesobacillus]|uniref:DUF4025 domain-containing protein n=1 Tax=Mesobacillus stamsii TaxID=225347 RepID=A0ABU0FTV0_9BACI|nr:MULTISPECIES: hypothetical protein [Mesobacillus]MDQ0413357.1 hypothetical protein [Mesobacillus stamsii]
MDSNYTEKSTDNKIESPSVTQQRKELEKQNHAGNTKGTTNEIQQMVTDEGVNQ